MLSPTKEHLHLLHTISSFRVACTHASFNPKGFETTVALPFIGVFTLPFVGVFTNEYWNNAPSFQVASPQAFINPKYL